VRLTKAGANMRQADIKERKRLMRDLLLDLKIFKHFADRLEQSENKELTEEDALKDLTELFPNEKPKVLFRHLVGWARYAELFSFDARRAILKPFEKEYLGKPPSSRLREAGV
jgi:hypothetical protein